MPISITASSVFFVIVSSVFGSPISLLWFPWVFVTLYFVFRTEVIMSLVEVFPTDPVTAIIGILNFSLYPFAICPKAFVVSSTFTILISSFWKSWFLSSRKFLQPFSYADSMKVWPSNFAPIMGTNSVYYVSFGISFYVINIYFFHKLYLLLYF